ncbi:hypothetical protein KJ359_004111 [Pestalotiopsis sp. 9143b]|nr:hypothetical protein KJ359_004111 [Pestalotiopsis sp. 9143b]
MATNSNLPSGAFITTLSGKRCTAIPKAKAVTSSSTEAEATSTSSSSTSTSTSTSSSSSSTSTSTSSSLSSSSTSTSTSTTAQATTTAAAAPVVPPAIAPVLTDTTTTAAAAPAPQQTLTSATSATSIAQIGTQVSPGAPIQTSTSVAATPLSSVTTPTTTTTNIPVVATPTIQTPESELQSQATQADDNNDLASTASAADTTSIAADPLAPVESSVLSESSATALSSITAGNAALLTTIGTASNANGGQAEATGTTTGGSGTSASSNSKGISTSTTVAVVGGVVGGVVAFALIAFLVWFWRKRIRQKRRSTLLTPLGPESGFGSAGEKVPYSISRNSIGPTGIAEKLKALVGVNVRKIRGRFGGHSRSPSVNLNRGNSQYLERPAHSRETSADYGSSAKDRLLGFFGRFNDKVRGERDDNEPSSTRAMKPAAARSNSQPDFLTLLSMDDKQLAAQASQGRTSMNNPRRSQSAGSNEHFLGRLNLNFDSANPFSDDNAMLRDSAKVAPLTIMNPDNPFSDANAVQQPTATKQTGPATYVQNIRRSRGMSVGGATTRPSSNAPSVWRESSTSVESFATRRNKFRSDPFDLDRPELLSSSAGSQAPMPTRDSRASRSSSGVRASGGPLPPHPAHTRNPSLTSSKYSSGVASIDQWSDPGPDVGPASSRYDSPTPTGERRGTGARKSGGSQGSVGKAY